MTADISPNGESNCGLAPAESGCGSSAEASPLNAVEMTAWRVLRTANERLMAELNRDLGEAAGVSLSEYEILVRLSEAPEGRLRMSSLAAETEQSRSRLTHTVSRLEKRNLVLRFTCDSDKRGVHCGLTEGGREFLTAAAPRHLRAVKRYFLDNYTQQQLVELSGLLSQIVDQETSS